MARREVMFNFTLLKYNLSTIFHFSFFFFMCGVGGGAGINKFTRVVEKVFDCYLLGFTRDSFPQRDSARAEPVWYPYDNLFVLLCSREVYSDFKNTNLK